MGSLDLRLLGAPQLLRDGQPVGVATRKALALLIFLAVEGGAHTRERLITLLWPESDTAQGRASLRTALVYLREALGDAAGLISAQRDALAFEPRGTDVVITLDIRAIQQVQAGDLTALQLAAERWRGEFLDGFTLPDAPAFDDWVAIWREQLFLQAMRVFDWLSMLQSDRGEYDQALATALRWIGAEPLSDAACRRLMSLYLLTGKRAVAAQAYASFCAVLDRELGAEPEAATRALAGRTQQLEHRASSTARPSAGDPPRHPFVGRASEHRELAACFRRVQQYQPAAVVLIGEPGIGKTRLADEFLAWGEVQGTHNLRGAASESGGRIPFQVVAELLRSNTSTAEAKRTRLVGPIWEAELARLLPELREQTPTLPPPLATSASAEGVTRLFESVVRLVQALADQTPVILMVDDLQWVDESSLDLLLYAARRWSAAALPIMVLFTVRLEDLNSNPQVREWLLSVDRAFPLTYVTLSNLDLEAAEQLATALGATDSAAIAAASAGHPLYLVEAVRSAAPPGTLPPRMRQVIAARLDRLSRAAASAALVAAVFGDATTVEQIARISRLEEEVLVGALEELLTRGILAESGGRLHFTHAQIRTVAYGQATDLRRKMLHRRVLELLERSEAPAAQRAYHAQQAGLLEQAWALHLVAGDTAFQLFAVRSALRHYDQAQQLAPLTVAQAEVWLRLGRAHEISGEIDGAQETYAALLAAARAAEAAAIQCIALNRLATLAARNLADPVTPAALLEDALQIASAHTDIEGLAETEWNLAHFYGYQARRDEMLAHGERALNLARAIGVPALIARALNQQAFAHTVLGSVLEALPYAEEAYTLYRVQGDRAMEADSLCLLADACVRSGDLARGLAAARAACTLTATIEDSWGEANSAVRLGLALLEAEEWREALQTAQHGCVIARQHGIMPLLVLNLLVLGSVQRASGALADALHTHQEAWSLAEQMAVPFFQAMVLIERCADRVYAEDWDAAVADAHAAYERHQPDIIEFPGFAAWCLIAALVRAGAHQRAAQEVDQLGRLIGDNRRYRLVWLKARAAVVSGDERAGTLREALALARDLKLPREARELESVLE